MARVMRFFDTMDRRIIHLLVVLAIVVPLLLPIGLPVQVTASTRQAFDAIEKVPKGSIALFSPEIGPTTMTELWPTAEAQLYQLLSKDVRIVMFFTFGGATAPVFGERLWQNLQEQYFPDKEYGTHVVILPYRTGLETAIAAAAGDFRGTYPKDYYGTPISQLPLMDEVHSVKDFSILCVLSGWGPEFWVRQIGQPYGVPIVPCCTGIVAPSAHAYVAAGQVQGLVCALGGAAEYEQLLKRPGRAASSMDAQSGVHLIAVLLIILGNLGAYVSKKYPAAHEGGDTRVK